jgi:hypothetical protein
MSKPIEVALQAARKFNDDLRVRMGDRRIWGLSETPTPNERALAECVDFELTEAFIRRHFPKAWAEIEAAARDVIARVQ